ncbi:hypothetical protein [Kibdelosporangium philippinense]
MFTRKQFSCLAYNMAEWWARRQFEQPVTMALLVGLVNVGVLVGTWAIASTGFELYFLPLAAFYGLAITYSTGFRPRIFEDAFPPGTGIDEKMHIWRIVRNGGPVDDPELAPKVAHHARWRFSPRSPAPVLASFGPIAALVVVQAAFTSDSWNDTAMYVIAAAMLLVTVPLLIRRSQHAKTARRVNDQVFQLLKGTYGPQ